MARATLETKELGRVELTLSDEQVGKLAMIGKNSPNLDEAVSEMRTKDWSSFFPHESQEDVEKEVLRAKHSEDISALSSKALVLLVKIGIAQMFGGALGLGVSGVKVTDV